MSLKVRRVVTGHDNSGRAVVKIDEISKNAVSHRKGAESAVIWSTKGFPVNNDGDEDTSAGLVEFEKKVFAFLGGHGGYRF